jgi:Flp pilus assembly protein TadD
VTVRRRTILLFAALLAVGGFSTAVVSWRRAPGGHSGHLVDTGSPYKNTRPGVKFVGDAACTRCHAQIAETYRQHPMGRSLGPIASSAATGGEGAGDRVLFESHGLQYSIESREGHVFHRETRRDPSGLLVARNEAEVQFAVGSGRQGVAYLIERDGFLFQSPITWYVREQKWDLSPGYEKSNVHFDRPIQSDCLYCHANRVEHVAGTVNRYRPPIFEGHAIGCERCHGPGELHVKRPTVVAGRDPTIVNPSALESSLRDAVCEQCHLIGHRRVVRLDSRAEDYRPGLPFFQFWTVLQPATGPAENRVIGQVEQMHESRCFRASQGRLGCVSCHDPHQLPAPEHRVNYYRERCLECHTDPGCRLPAAVRLQESADNDCTACHMSQLRSSDVLHVATTNHRITRHAGDRDRSPTLAVDARDSRRSVVVFHSELMDERDRAAADRDIGVALCRDGPKGAAVALPLLEAALAARPDDVTAWESKAFALGQLGRGEEAMAAFRRALASEPDRETTLTGAAYLGARGRRREDAISYWRRDLAINPWRSEYHAELATLLFQNHDWRHAADACRQTLRLNPANQEVRMLLVRCYLRLQDNQAARRELQILLGFNPPDRDELLRWFTPLSGSP